MKNKIAIFLLALMLIIGLTSSNTQAIPWDPIDKGVDLYGNLNQQNVSDIWGNVACGPTAAVNSFVYLQRKYPGIYDHKLVPDQDGDLKNYTQAEMAAVAKDIGENYMNTVVDNETWFDWFVYGKREYIEDKIPGMTIYEAQYSWSWNDRPPPGDPNYNGPYDLPSGSVPDWFENSTNPTAEFIYDELKDCEDVEILITGDYNHYLTLYGFSWDTTGGANGLGGGVMNFMDPWRNVKDVPALPGNADIWFDGIELKTNYKGGTSMISGVISESPVPEPATIILLGSGLLGVGYQFRKKKRPELGGFVY